jgi:hypothetical protein
MKILTNKEANYSLHNNENFKKELDTDINDIVDKISELFIEYFKFIKENIKLKKSKLSQFIIIRGLDTIINTFNFILFYSKNLDMTYFHCQKAYYYYVEFVGQISEDEKTFLQLSSRDASTYVYKKTIFDINSEIKKCNEEISDYTRLKLEVINIFIDLYKTILLKLINNDFINLEKINIIQNIYKKLHSLTNKSKIKLLNDIVERLYYDVEDINYFLEICFILTKKLVKNNEILNNCITKFSSYDFKIKIKEPVDKFVSWFTN